MHISRKNAIGLFTMMIAIGFARVAIPEVALLRTTKDFWTDHALVVGNVSDLKATRDGSRSFLLDVKLVAFTSTPLAVNSPIQVSGFFDAPESAASGEVSEGSIILLCMQHGNAGWGIETNAIPFMPNGSSILVMSGMEDPSVTPILNAVRKAFLASTLPSGRLQ